MADRNAMKIDQKLRNVALIHIKAHCWGPSTLAKYLIERPHLLPLKHRGKDYDRIFGNLRGLYCRLEKEGSIIRVSKMVYELSEKALQTTLRFVSASEEPLEIKSYIPHNKRLCFLIKTVNLDRIMKEWKEAPLKNWSKYIYENDKITAELVNAGNLFGIKNAKGIIIRLKDPKWQALVKTEQDIEEVNNLYDSEIIHEANKLVEKMNEGLDFNNPDLELDTLNPKEVLQDAEIHDAFTARLPGNLRFTDTDFKYNSTYGGEEGNRKLEFNSAAVIKDYVRESVNTERMKTVEELLPEIVKTMKELVEENKITAQNFNAHIPYLKEGTKASIEIKESMSQLPHAIAQAVKEALSRRDTFSKKVEKKLDKNLKEWIV